MLLRRVNVHDREKIASFVDRLSRMSEGLDIGKNIFEMKYELVDVYLRNLREKKLFEVLVAEEGGRIVGVCDIKMERNEDAFQHVAEVGIMVSSDAQRRGVASSLLSRLVERARGLGIEVLIAYVREGNIASQRLFEKNGFKLKGKIPCYFKYGGRYYDGLIYWRKCNGC